MPNPVVEHRADAAAGRVNLIQSCAKDFRGTCIRKFSQSTNPVSSIIAMLPVTKEGICTMLSASWIGHLVNRKSMWDSMYFGGVFNAASIVTLMHNFVDASDAEDWSELRKSYFKQHNVAHFKTGTTLGNANAASGTLAQDMATAIRASTGAYISMDIYSPTGAGHAVAASARFRGRYLFFDPNYGEFSFTDLGQMQNFLAILCRLSGYSQFFGQVRSDIWR